MRRPLRSVLVVAACWAPAACGPASSTIVAPLGAAAAATPAATATAAAVNEEAPVPLGPKTHCVPNQPVDPYADVRIIARYYDLGYLECSVEKRSERGDEVCFTVNPGLRYRVSGVHVVDRDELPGDPLGAPAELAAFFHSAPGSWFSRQTFVDNLSALRRRYRDAGYASVEADPITDLDRRAARISVDVPITRGPLTTIDRVDVVGNVRNPGRGDPRVAPPEERRPLSRDALRRVEGAPPRHRGVRVGRHLDRRGARPAGPHRAHRGGQGEVRRSARP